MRTQNADATQSAHPLTLALQAYPYNAASLYRFAGIAKVRLPCLALNHEVETR